MHTLHTTVNIPKIAAVSFPAALSRSIRASLRQRSEPPKTFVLHVLTHASLSIDCILQENNMVLWWYCIIVSHNRLPGYHHRNGYLHVMQIIYHLNSI